MDVNKYCCMWSCDTKKIYLEVLAQLVHHPSVLAADLLTPGAAVRGVVAHVDARRRERGALRARADGALGGALALGAVVRVQEVPLPQVIGAAVSLAGVLLLPWHREAGPHLSAQRERQEGAGHPLARAGALCHGASGLIWMGRSKRKVCCAELDLVRRGVLQNESSHPDWIKSSEPPLEELRKTA